MALGSVVALSGQFFNLEKRSPGAAGATRIPRAMSGRAMSAKAISISPLPQFERRTSDTSFALDFPCCCNRSDVHVTHAVAFCNFDERKVLTFENGLRDRVV